MVAINLLLFASGLMLHSSIKVYMENVQEAMVGWGLVPQVTPLILITLLLDDQP